MDGIEVTHWEVRGIKVVFKATKVDELVGKECRQREEGAARQTPKHVSSRGEARRGWGMCRKGQKWKCGIT